MIIKNEVFPSMTKGRFYKFFIESDGSALTLTLKDLSDASLSDNYLKLPEGYHVLDIKHDINFIGAGSYACGLTSDSEGIQSVELPTASEFDYATFWIYAYKED